VNAANLKAENEKFAENKSKVETEKKLLEERQLSIDREEESKITELLPAVDRSKSQTDTA
jgi:hypothetical protein